MRRRSRHSRPEEAWTRRPAPPAARVTHMPPAADAVMRGLDPARLAPGARAEALASLGAAAGNGAVREHLARVRTDRRLDPPNGVREIMKVSGGTRGHTRMELRGSPPLFRATATSKDGAYAARPRPVTVPEPDFEVKVPGAGVHTLYELDGAPTRVLDVEPEWADRILQGEDDHVRDQTLAVDWTWKRVAELINRFATEPPATGATAAEAEDTAWRRFRDALPRQLRPAGDRASEEAQLAKWDDQVKTSAFSVLLRESRVARDLSGSHTPLESLKELQGRLEVMHLETGRSSIGTPTPEDLMQAAWKRLGTGS